MKIYIESESVSTADIHNALSSPSAEKSVYRIELQPPKASEMKRGGTDACSIVAVCLALEPSLRLIISALLDLLKIRKDGRIVIKGRTGRSVEVPGDTSPERLNAYIESAKQIDIDSIHLI